MPRPFASRHVTATLFRRPYAAVRAPPTRSKGIAPRPPPPPATSGPRSPIPQVETISKPHRLPWVVGSTFALVIGLYTVQLIIAANQPLRDPDIVLLSHQKDVAARYDDTADSFDSEVGVSEWLMRINGTRKSLARACRGNVLEVSVGTGRNLSYYDIFGEQAKVESLTFIDLSPQMVEVCKRKWQVLFSGKQASLRQDLTVRFTTGSALAPMPLTKEGGKYDTIIQTMGLCSTPSPKELLLNMAKHLNMQKKEARIYLLEHGRSYMPWLNRVLDNAAMKHAEIHGCWFNRDIGALVEEAAAESGLEVVRERRRHFGTTWLFELKPRNPETPLDEPGAGGADERMKKKKKTASWFGWMSS